MSRRLPPTSALWILERFGPNYQREALTGDLIEQYQQGETRWWFWRQVAAAIVVAGVARIHTMSWLPVLRVCSHLCAELGVVLGMCAVVDQSRHAHSFRELCTPTFTITIAALSAAIIGASCLAIWTSRQRYPGTVNRSVTAVFAVITLGFGALTWAATARENAAVRDGTDQHGAAPRNGAGGWQSARVQRGPGVPNCAEVPGGVCKSGQKSLARAEAP